ncbi:unnamed protein product [Amoebophrya sp. A25]|nr:unnamed protein product [Amoebophrya sp. A25]|eukprot:GSA25T00013991001.1
MAPQLLVDDASSAPTQKDAGDADAQLVLQRDLEKGVKSKRRPAWTWSDTSRQLRFLGLGFGGYFLLIAVLGTVIRLVCTGIQDVNNLQQKIADVIGQGELSTTLGASNDAVATAANSSSSSSSETGNSHIVVETQQGRIIPYEDLDTRAHMFAQVFAIPLSVLFIFVFTVPFLLIVCASSEKFIRPEDFRFFHESHWYNARDSPFIQPTNQQQQPGAGESSPSSPGAAYRAIVDGGADSPAARQTTASQPSTLYLLYQYAFGLGLTPADYGEPTSSSEQSQHLSQLTSEHQITIAASRCHYVLRWLAFRLLSLAVGVCMFISSGLPLVFSVLIFQLMDSLGAEMQPVRQTLLSYLFPLACSGDACADITTQDKLVTNLTT